MGIICNKYRNFIDYVWYDSSNIDCSRYLNSGEYGTLEVTFKKNGATYRYENVKIEDYLYFKNSSSNGSVFSKSIVPKYKGELLKDATGSNVDRREENELLKAHFTSLDENRDRHYHIKVDYSNQECALFEGSELIYCGNMNNVSILNLFKMMDIPLNEEECDNLETYRPKL